jgi:hypothetical protein
LKPPNWCTDCGVNPRWAITGIQQGFNDPEPFASAFELDRFGPAFLDETAGVFHALFNTHMERLVGHVTDHQRLRFGAGDQGGMVNHFVHGHFQGVFLSLQHHAQRISDQDDINAGVGGDPRGREIIGRHRSDLFTPALFPGQAQNRLFFQIRLEHSSRSLFYDFLFP